MGIAPLPKPPEDRQLNNWHDAAVAAAELLDNLETEYAEIEEDVEVGRVMVVVELTGRHGTDDEWSGVFYRCNEPKRWIQYGLLDSAKRAVLASSESLDLDDED